MDQEKKLQDSEKFDYVNKKDRRQIFVDNLIGGLAWGVGSIIGATIIVGVLGFFIARSRQVPIVGDAVKVILDEINKGKEEITNPQQN